MNINIILSPVMGTGRVAEAARFVFTGGVAAAIQYAVYLLCLVDDRVSAEIATPVSYCVSLIFNFVLSNLFTFRTKPNKKNAVAFVASHMVNMGLQTLLVSIFSRIMSDSIALVPAMLICIPVNFLMVRFALTNHRFTTK